MQGAGKQFRPSARARGRMILLFFPPNPDQQCRRQLALAFPGQVTRPVAANFSCENVTANRCWQMRRFDPKLMLLSWPENIARIRPWNIAKPPPEIRCATITCAAPVTPWPVNSNTNSRWPQFEAGRDQVARPPPSSVSNVHDTLKQRPNPSGPARGLFGVLFLHY
jgi:hypothetical protein